MTASACHAKKMAGLFAGFFSLSHLTLIKPTLYRATRVNGQQVVLKLALNPRQKHLLLNEVRFLHQYQSAFWGRLIDYNSLEGCDAALLTYHQGETLGQSSLPSNKWRHQAELALKAVHQTGHVHGDIKPDNLIIGKDNKLSLIDFGSVAPLHYELSQINTSLSPSYASPERYARKGKVKIRHDYYSLGVIIDEISHTLAASHPKNPIAMPSRYHVILTQARKAIQC